MKSMLTPTPPASQPEPSNPTRLGRSLAFPNTVLAHHVLLRIHSGPLVGLCGPQKMVGDGFSKCLATPLLMPRPIQICLLRSRFAARRGWSVRNGDSNLEG